MFVLVGEFVNVSVSVFVFVDVPLLVALFVMVGLLVFWMITLKQVSPAGERKMSLQCSNH